MTHDPLQPPNRMYQTAPFAAIALITVLLSLLLVMTVSIQAAPFVVVAAVMLLLFATVRVW